jgi:hypothetical protein
MIKLPEGYRLTVQIYHDGHKASEGDLIYSSDSVMNRRPSFWESENLTNEEEAVLRKFLFGLTGEERYAP